MAGLEGLVVRAAFKQREVGLARLAGRGFLGLRDAVLEAFDIDDFRLVRQGRAHGDEVVAVIDIDHMLIVELQCLDEAFAQLRQEVQRAAEKGDMAADGASLCEVADGLVDDGLKNRQGDIGLLCTIIHEGLNIGLGKDAAARSNRVNLLALGCEVIEPLGIGGKQRRHMVDERARAARADAVHALLRRIAEVRDFRVLAAELHNGIRLRDQLFDGSRAGDDFLHERQADALGNAHASRARQGERKFLVTNDGFQMRQILLQGIADL